METQPVVNRSTLRLRGVILGAPTEPFYIGESPDNQIEKLQEKVKTMNPRRFGHLKSHEIALWKLNPPMSSKDVAVAEFLGANTPNSELKLQAGWLDPGDLVGDHFILPLAHKFIHFVVQASAEPSRGRKRSASSLDSAGYSDTGLGPAREGSEIRLHATKRRRISDERERERAKALSNLHAKAWGKPWPHQFRRTISKREIINDKTGPVNKEDLDFKEGPLRDILCIPTSYQYDCFKGMRSFTDAFAVAPILGNVLVVRGDYEILRKALEEEENYKRRCGFVVTGQPGIGKSAFLFYLLLHRLERCLPTAVQLNDKDYFIFDGQGAVFRRLATYDARLKACWALADSNAYVQQPCERFTSLAKCTIQMSPPQPERWKEWIKQRYGVCIVMDLPTVPEIAAIVKEKGHDPSSTLSLVRKWGPSTRNILRSINSRSRNRKIIDPIAAEAQGAAFELSENPSGITVASHGLFLPAAEGPTVVFLRRKVGSESLGSDACSHFIPTPALIDIFEDAHQSMQNENALKLFSALSWHSLTRTAAGWLHEVAVHKRLSRGNPPLTISPATGPSSEILPSSRLLQGTLQGLGEAKHDDSFYWIPSVVNFPGVDSVLGQSDGELFVIQATIARDHKSPEEGIKKVWGALNNDARTRRRWHFVIVTDASGVPRQLMGKLSKDVRGLELGVPIRVWSCVYVRQ